MHGISTFVGAWLLNWGWKFDTVLTVLAIPALIAGVGLWLKGAIYSRKWSK